MVGTCGSCISDVEKAFDNVWHSALRLKIFQLDLSTKMTRWLSDFLVGRLIQVNVNDFFSSQTKSLDRIAQNPLVGESISSRRLNPAWDRFPTPLSVVRPVSS